MKRFPVPRGYYVYTWRRPCGEPFYVGLGYGGRCFSRARNRHTLAVLDKIEASGQEITIEIVSVEDREQAFRLEIELIARYGRLDLGTGTLTNKSDGGEHGQIGRIVSAETRATVAEKTRQSKMGNQYNKGTTMSEEQRAHLSRVMSGRKQTEEHRMKRSLSQKGRPKSPEHREKIRQGLLARRNKT